MPAFELGASIAAFDATDFGRLGRFFDALPAPIDHLLISGPGPYHPQLAEFDLDAARRDIDAHLLLPVQVATNVASKVRPGGTLLFLGVPAAVAPQGASRSLRRSQPRFRP